MPQNPDLLRDRRLPSGSRSSPGPRQPRSPEPPASPKIPAQLRRRAPPRSTCDGPPPRCSPSCRRAEVEVYLDGVIKAVDALKTVSADIAQKVDMLDQKFEISGRYRKELDNRLYLFPDVHGLPDASGKTTPRFATAGSSWDSQVILVMLKTSARSRIAQVLEKFSRRTSTMRFATSSPPSSISRGPDELLKGLQKRRPVRPERISYDRR